MFIIFTKNYFLSLPFLFQFEIGDRYSVSKTRLTVLLMAYNHFLVFNVPFPASFYLFSSFHQLTVHMFIIKFRRIMDSNRRPLESVATALPAEPQPLPKSFSSFYLCKSVTSQHITCADFTYTIWLKQCLLITQLYRMNNTIRKQS